MTTLAGRLLLLVAALHAPASLAVQAGDPAPPFALPGADGTTVALADFAGKVVLVDFWASWCGPCAHSLPFLDGLQKRLGDGFVVVGVNLDEVRAEADAFLAKRPVGFRIAYDGEGRTPEAYGLRGMPSSYLVGRDGRIAAVHVGFRDADRATIEARVRDALQAAPP